MRLPAALALAALLGCAGCAGIFQRPLPQPAADYVATARGEQLLVGAAERDITPAGDVWLAGFALARGSTGVQSPLKARALVLALGGQRVAIVGIDSLGAMREDVDWIKAGIQGFANGSVFVCASHTHAAPDLIGLWGYYLLSSGRDPGYVALVRRQVAAAVAAALAAAAPARLELGQARLPPQGLVRNSNRRGVFDRRLTVLHARAVDDGRPLGTLLHLACHPEVLRRDNTELSADFVGALCDDWRAAGHGQAVFVNGELGAMVTPDVQPRNAAGVPIMAGQLADLAAAALAAARPLGAEQLEVRRRDLYVPLSTMGLKLGRLAMVIERELYDGCARSSVGYLRLGEFEAVAVPGEMEPVLAARLRAQLRRPRLLVFGLCDDELGYLLREVDARDPEFAYERSMSPCTRAGELVVEALAGSRDVVSGTAAGAGASTAASR